MTTQQTALDESPGYARRILPDAETVIAGAVTALTGLNGAWLSTSARYLLSTEAVALLAVGTVVTGAYAARHVKQLITASDGPAARTVFTTAVFIMLITIGACIGRASAIETINLFGR